MSQFLSTNEVAAGRRLDYWNSVLQSELPGMSVAAAQDISASWKSRRIGELLIARVSSQKACIQRWQSMPPAPEFRRTVAHLQSEGTSLAFNEDMAELINTGDLALGEAGVPYAINISDRNVVILIDFPSEVLPVALPAQGTLIARSQAVARLHDFALSVLEDELNELHDEENAEECIAGVFAALLRTCASTATQAARSDDILLCHRMFELIESSLADSTLRTGTIARRLAVSCKQVQRIFATLGMTPSQFILNRRVNLAAFMLRSRSFDGTMTDVALETGFSDTAHFCRSFRRIFGTTPTEYAKLQRRAERHDRWA